MTRRIAAAILIASTLMLIVGGLAMYWAARQALLAELDATLYTRAVTLLGGAEGVPAGDRFVVENDFGQTIASSVREPAASGIAPRIVDRQFIRGPSGDRLRKLVVDAQRPGTAGTVRLVYSSPAAGFDRMQSRLAWIIATTIVAGTGLTVATAAIISRHVMKPLYTTADVIGRVDESNLDRRIDGSKVPAELAPMVQRLNEMLARLDEAFKRQHQFLADAAHELRTPVAALRAAFEISLSRVRSTEQLTETMQRALGETIRLGQIVEDLLACVRSGTTVSLKGAWHRFDATQLVKESVELVRPLAEAKSQHLTLSGGDGPIHLHGEPNTLRTVIGNLLSNATAYTPVGGAIDLCLDANATSELLIQVRDDGPGIPRKLQDRIFEPFFRIDESRSPRDHLGLGLYLVKRAVQRFGGRLGLQSEVGQGATFSIWLPRGVDVPAEAILRETAAHTGGMAACSSDSHRVSPTVLIVGTPQT